MFGSAENEGPTLTNREIIFKEFQAMWSQSTNVTDRQTDGRMDRWTEGWTDDMWLQDRALRVHRVVIKLHLNKTEASSELYTLPFITSNNNKIFTVSE